ncbi:MULTISPECIES: ester cyclase [unclassified Haladaptatus]|uniref:ester cyclase n=1 Tax=unclassified Haladaptatus TaxID=2622732 RepID=UPI0023E8B290|nr:MULTISPECIES: ester cyclase [unclassified Haladaptatus]
MAVSTAAQNKELVERTLDECWNKGDFDALSDLCHDDIRVLDDDGNTVAHGPQEFQKHVEAWRTAFPDFKVETKELVAEDDTVVVRFMEEGTFKDKLTRGELMGMEPTGKHYRSSGVAFHRIKDGKLAEFWVIDDSLNYAQQLGVLPDDLSSVGS